MQVRTDSATQLRPRTLKVGDSTIRNICSRDTTTCCRPQATTSDVNRELQNILMKHKTANTLLVQIHIHVGENYIHKEQSELLKKDFNELFETLKWLSSDIHQWTTPSKRNKQVFTVAWAEHMAAKNLQYKRSELHWQLQSFLDTGATVSTGWASPKQICLKSAKGQYLLLPQSSFCSL